MITFSNFITEKRKNPEQNVSEPVLEQLTKIYKEHPKAYVTYTALQKFGANPTSRWNTPLGICSYPLHYVIERKGRVPFAGQQPYIFVFENEGNLLNLGDYTPVGKQFKTTIKNMLGVVSNIDVTDSKSDIWYKMYNAIHRYINKGNDNSHWEYDPDVSNKGPYGTIARKILINMGYDGVSDPGDGIIHENEPTQTIFFNIRKLKVVDMVHNKIESRIDPSYHKKIETVGEFDARIESASQLSKRDRDVEKAILTLGDQYLKTDGGAFRLIQYAEKNKIRIPTFEPVILKTGDFNSILRYCTDVIQGRWPEAEPLFLKYHKWGVDYATRVIRGRWPELEELIKDDKITYEKYLKTLSRHRYNI